MTKLAFVLTDVKNLTPRTDNRSVEALVVPYKANHSLKIEQMK